MRKLRFVTCEYAVKSCADPDSPILGMSVNYCPVTKGSLLPPHEAGQTPTEPWKITSKILTEVPVTKQNQYRFVLFLTFGIRWQRVTPGATTALLIKSESFLYFFSSYFVFIINFSFGKSIQFEVVAKVYY